MKRKTKVKRQTSETDIHISLDIDGRGEYEINTGIHFMNHMLESFSRHGQFDLKVTAQGDTEIDDHHTIEDLGIVLGQAFQQALGNKMGIKRISNSLVPMDEALALVVVDISGRSYVVLDLQFNNKKVGDLSTLNVNHFLESFAQSAKINLHARVEGENDHHKIEAIFKALAISLREASRVEHDQIPSTKGLL
jgi:imidazoleglycerol-phosphate dehydratase